MSQLLMSSIYERVREKKESYRRYNFERLQEEAFATFFDLAQEHTTIDYLYQICVAVPKEFFGLESRLYVIDPRTSRLEESLQQRRRASFRLKNARVLTYRLARLLMKPMMPGFCRSGETRPSPNGFLFLTRVRSWGLFEIYPKEKVDEKEHFFLEKFTNRIGYNLHQKLLIQHNINHIKFINQLVSDIEHNVISPNIYYKLFLLRLKKHHCGIQPHSGADSRVHPLPSKWQQGPVQRIV